MVGGYESFGYLVPIRIEDGHQTEVVGGDKSW